jgi:predicted TIM-barrel fold metal-dependent hydrolase
MIFDSHCHAWRLWPYDADVPDIRYRGSVEALLWEMDKNDVERAAVICTRMGKEVSDACSNDDNNEYVSLAAKKHPDRLIMVADVDGLWTQSEYHKPGASQRLREAAERYDLTAFTHYVEQGNDGWFATDDGAEFFATAADLQLVASLAISPAWQSDLRPIALAHPTLPLLIHHQGMARLNEPTFEADLRAVLANADLPNVYLKLSGFHYLSRQSWDFPFREAQEKVLRPLIRAYGPDRLLWGSDFSAARRDVTYTQTLEVVRRRAEGLSPDHLDKILGGTSEIIFRTRHPIDLSGQSR